MSTRTQNSTQQEQVQGAARGRALAVYYSRTGVTKTVAEAIAQRLGADVEELIDTKSRKGPLGFVIAGKDAVRKKLTRIEPVKKTPADYDLVVIGTPVWAGTMASAVRTYLSHRGSEMKKVALFCTQGGKSPGHTLEDMQELCGKPPVETLSLRTKTVKSGDFAGAVDAFVERLKQS